MTALRPDHLPLSLRRLPAPAVLAAAFAILLGAVFLVSALTGQLTLDTLAPNAGLLAITVVIAAVGLVVVAHQPGNAIGWLQTGTALFLLAVENASIYATYVYRLGHHGLPVLAGAALVISQLFFAAVITFPLVILLFPDGRLPSARWKWAVGAYLAITAAGPLCVVAVTAVAIRAGHPDVLADGDLRSVDHPSGGTAFLSAVYIAFFTTVIVSWLSALAWQAASWRRSSGERRQQLKWLMSGAAICGASGIWAFATTSGLWEVAIVGLGALPVGIAVGIVKYRLYEIEHLISRTVSYAIVTGLLVGVYAGLVTLTSQVLPFTSKEAVAVSTLAVAALFNPVRHRVQRMVDRRFNRARYDADAIVAAFAAGLQEAVDLDTVRDDLVDAVQRAVEPAHVSVWLNRSGSGLTGVSLGGYGRLAAAGNAVPVSRSASAQSRAAVAASRALRGTRTVVVGPTSPNLPPGP